MKVCDICTQNEAFTYLFEFKISSKSEKPIRKGLIHIDICNECIPIIQKCNPIIKGFNINYKQNITKIIKEIEEDIKYYEEEIYDYVIFNEQMKKSLNKLKGFVS